MSARWTMALALGAVSTFVALGVLAPAFDNGFWSDDFALLEHAQRAVQDPGALLEPWVPPFHRPLAQAVFTLEYTLWGLEPRGYLITHALLHALNATLGFLVLQGPLGAARAAAAAVLFAAGLGFYGKAVLWIANLPELLAMAFVLLTALCMRSSQRSRSGSRRTTYLLLGACTYAAGIASKESAYPAIVMVAGLLWPQRRNLLALASKLGLLVAVAAVGLVLALRDGSNLGAVLTATERWLRLPYEALRLASLMLLPLQSSDLASASAWSARAATAADALRPFLVALLGAGAVLGFVRGSGAVRWLIATTLAFLLPYGWIELPGSWLDLRYAYVPAFFLCGLFAWSFAELWRRADGRVQGLLAAALGLVIAASISLTQRLERKYDAFGRLPANLEAVERLRAGLGADRGIRSRLPPQAPAPAANDAPPAAGTPPETRDQKSAPSDTLVPGDSSPVPES